MSMSSQRTKGRDKLTSIATLANLPLDNNSTARSNLTRRPVRAAINSNASRVHNVGGKSGKWNQITTKEKVFGEGQNEGVHGLIARASLLRLYGPSNRTLSRSNDDVKRNAENFPTPRMASRGRQGRVELSQPESYDQGTRQPNSKPKACFHHRQMGLLPSLTIFFRMVIF